jgi:hypothetical protein
MCLYLFVFFRIYCVIGAYICDLHNIIYFYFCVCLLLYSGNTSSIHPVDYKTLPELVAFSEKYIERTAASTTAFYETMGITNKDRVSITNHHLSAKALKADAEAAAGPAGAQVGTKVPWVFPQPSTLAYVLGQDILVQPLVFDVANKTADAIVRVEFPELSDVIPATADTLPAGTVWLDWWEPTNPKKAHAAGETVTSVLPIWSYPVYVRKGAFIPLHPVSYAPEGAPGPGPVQVSEESHLLEASAMVQSEKVHFTWFAPSTASDASRPVQYALRESVVDGPGVVASAWFATPDTITAQISARVDAPTDMAAGFAFVGVSKPSDVSIDAWTNARCLHEYVDHTSTLTVSCANIEGGVRVTATGTTPTL